MTPTPPADYDVAIVSCDIIGHSAVRAREVQLARVAGINAIVAETIAALPPGDVVWASGGDGGHVVFRCPGWAAPVVALLCQLRRWSRLHRVPLRVTGHHGPVTHISGADGRVQIVGAGINFAGWLLTRGTDDGIVVSEHFRRALDAHLDELTADVRFHDPRVLRHKVHADQQLLLLSTGGERSCWALPVEEDDARLGQALAHDDGWDVLYFAKRILQVNTRDQRAASALHRLLPHQLRYRDPNTAAAVLNPFLAHLEPEMLREVVQLGQLVERKYNDVICRFGDAGDTLFVILRGQVGVYKSEGEGSERPADPAFVHQEGEIVGELAFALSRNRTADLVALSDVALLSFSYHEIDARLAQVPASELARRQVARFISYRVLEHVSHNAAYLLGRDRGGPLAAGRMPWQETLTQLRGHCRLSPVDSGKLTIGRSDMFPDEPPAARHGLYILASGELRSAPDRASLLGEDFPILWVDLPDLLVTPHRTFDIAADPVKVLFIGASGIVRLEPRKRESLREALRSALDPPAAAAEYDFDVFLCHTKADGTVVEEIARRLRDAGVRYWLDAEQIRLGDQVTRQIEAGLHRSRYVVPCISAHFNGSNWARAEYGAVLHEVISRRSPQSVIPLMLDDVVDEVPLLLRDTRRASYRRETDFAEFLRFVGGGPAGGISRR